MRIYVTGGAGYLGCVLVRKLLADPSNEIVVVDRLDHGNLGLAEACGEQYKRVILARTWAKHAMPGSRESVPAADVIIHLAGIVGHPACSADPYDAIRTNVCATDFVCQQAQLLGARLVFVSTDSVYGPQLGRPVHEGTELNPQSLYGQSKAMAERLVLEAGGTVLRLSSLFGPSPRMRWDLMVHYFYKTLTAGFTLNLYQGGVSRALLHVEDAAAALQMAVTERIPPGIWGVGHERLVYRKRDLAREIAVVAGVGLGQITEADTAVDIECRDYNHDFEKIAHTGWVPAFGIAAGVAQLEAAHGTPRSEA